MALVEPPLLQVSLLLVTRIVRLPRLLISSSCSGDGTSKEVVTLFGNVLNTIVRLDDKRIGI